MFDQNNGIEVISNGTNWYIPPGSKNISINFGKLYRTNYISKNMGNCEITYGTLSNPFTFGEIVTGGTSGSKGIIIADSGSVLKVLVIPPLTTGFTSAETITGFTSSETAIVSANTQDQETSCFHNLGIPISKMRVKINFSVDGTDNNMFEILVFQHGPASYQSGLTLYAVDNDNLEFVTGASQGLVYYDRAHAIIPMTNTYYEITIEEI